MTLGEQRVRVDFNVANDDYVTLFKKKAAKLIDICEEQKLVDPSDEKTRLFELAKTNFELAAIWAVKAITTSKN